MIGESIEESDKWKITDSAVAPGGCEGHTASYKTRSIWGQANVRSSRRQESKVSCSSVKEKEDIRLISTMILDSRYSVLSYNNRNFSLLSISKKVH